MMAGMRTRASSLLLVTLTTILSLTSAHIVITYPGSRGNTLISNGTVDDTNGLMDYSTSSGRLFPYGMEWEYPCMLVYSIDAHEHYC